MRLVLATCRQPGAIQATRNIVQPGAGENKPSWATGKIFQLGRMSTLCQGINWDAFHKKNLFDIPLASVSMVQVLTSQREL